MQYFRFVYAQYDESELLEHHFKSLHMEAGLYAW